MPASARPVLERLSETLLRLYAIEEPSAIPLAFADGLAGTIRCANAGYNVIRWPDPPRASPEKIAVGAEPPGGGVVVIRSRGVKVPSEEEHPLVRNLAEHPIVTQLERRRDASVLKFSDFLDRRAYHRTRLYNEYYRRSNTQEQMGFALSYGRESLVLMVANHVGRDRFSEEDRGLAALLRPHLVQIERTVRRLRRWKDLVEGYDAALCDHPTGCILLDRELRATHASPAVGPWLRRFFAGEPSLARGLPETVARWILACEARLRSGEAALDPLRPLVRTLDGETLTLSFRPAGPAVLPVVLVEWRPAPTCGPRAAERGLTPRETEILDLVAAGRTNPEIAAILGISPRTAEKHAERIFAKLGVENRQAALVWAREHAGPARAR